MLDGEALPREKPLWIRAHDSTRGALHSAAAMVPGALRRPTATQSDHFTLGPATGPRIIQRSNTEHSLFQHGRLPCLDACAFHPATRQRSPKR